MSINLSEMFFITLQRIFKLEKGCEYFKLSLILLVLLIIGITDHKLQTVFVSLFYFRNLSHSCNHII